MWKIKITILAIICSLVSPLVVTGNELQFDPADNLPQKMEIAINKAKPDNKVILLYVGDDSCIWCKRLNLVIDNHTKIQSVLSDSVVMVKAYRGGTDESVSYLRALPKYRGVPHFYLFDCDGKLLLSQDTEVFESGNGYNEEKLLVFFEMIRSGKDLNLIKK